MSTIATPGLPTRALIDRFDADGALAGLVRRGVWADRVPQEVPGAQDAVAVVVAYQSGRWYGTGDAGRHGEFFYAFQAVGVAALIDTILAAAARIDEMFTRQPRLTLAGFRLIGAWLDDPIDRSEPETAAGGVRWEWRGGIYRLMVVAV